MKGLGNPLVIFTVVFLSTVALSVVSRFTAGKSVEYSFRYAPGGVVETRHAPVPVTPYSTGLKSPAADTGTRIEEIVGLGIAFSLQHLAERRVSNVSPTVGELVNRTTAAGLLPPTLAEKNGSLEGTLSRISVRYRPEPFGVEVISQPVALRFGPPLVLRLPQTPLDPRGAPDAVEVLAFLRNPSAPVIPPPFAPISEFLVGGWSLQPIKLTDLPPDQAAAVERWLSVVGGHRP